MGVWTRETGLKIHGENYGCYTAVPVLGAVFCVAEDRRVLCALAHDLLYICELLFFTSADASGPHMACSSPDYGREL